MPEPSPTNSPASSATASPAPSSTAPGEQLAPPGAWVYEVLAALLLTFERFLAATAVALLVISSYAWWGSATSPLGELWKVSAVLLAIVVVCAAGHRLALARILRMTRDHVRSRRQARSPGKPPAHAPKD